MLWIPGPTEVRPAILDECSRSMIGHRSASMTELIERLDPGLQLAFGLGSDTTSRVGVHSASATAMMESALLGAGPRVLALVNGAFSRRWRSIAGTLGRDVDSIEVDWGDVVTPEQLDAKLTVDGPFDIVTLVSSETSTGTATALGPIGEVVRRHENTLLAVDLVSYIAGGPVDFDTNGLDFAFAGVQKAFALPPGVAVVCASERYMTQATTRENRGFYLDPITILEGHGARKTPATPCITLYYALAKQLEDISSAVVERDADKALRGADAWNARFARHRRMQERTLDWAAGHGFDSFPRRENGSPTVSCLRAGSLDVAAFAKGLEARGLQISNGYGPLKGETFRIGHMGDHTEAGLEDLLTNADEVLRSLR